VGPAGVDEVAKRTEPCICREKHVKSSIIVVGSVTFTASSKHCTVQHN
jgi:hypothetical protein